MAGWNSLRLLKLGLQNMHSATKLERKFIRKPWLIEEMTEMIDETWK